MQLPALEQKTHFISAGFDQSELPTTGALYEYTRSKESLFVWQMSYLEGVSKMNLELYTLHAH